MGNRFNRVSSSNRTVYICDEREGMPRTEFAVGKLDDIKEISKQYEPASSPFVMLYFRDKENNSHGVAKVSIPEYHDDIDKGLLGYIDEIKAELIGYMKRQNPGCEVKGHVSVHGTDDQAVLSMLKRYIKTEEIVKYII